jgi:predicted anti-sigma-YlaC factor YlaD
MTCNDIRELMPDLAAGMHTVTPEVDEHLHGCGECAAKLEEFRQTMALLDEWQVPEPSPYFDVRLRANLQEEMAKQPTGWLQWLRKPALALSLTVLMVVSITLFRSGNPVGSSGSDQVATAMEPGSAVSDLEALDKNHDLYSDFDVLDDLLVQQDVNANP